MDIIDVKIIKLLQKNARITASEIGSEINMSVPAVYNFMGGSYHDNRGAEGNQK